MKNSQSRKYSISGRCMLTENNMSGLFTAQHESILDHVLIDIFVADLCLFVLHATLGVVVTCSKNASAPDAVLSASSTPLKKFIFFNGIIDLLFQDSLRCRSQIIPGRSFRRKKNKTKGRTHFNNQKAAF